MAGDIGNPTKNPRMAVFALHHSIDLINNEGAAGKSAVGADKGPRVDERLRHNLTKRPNIQPNGGYEAPTCCARHHSSQLLT